MAFAEQLKRLRRARGLTQRELAARLDLSPSAVGMYEQGRREPDMELLLRIGAVFSVPTDTLLRPESLALRDLREVLQSLRDALLRGEITLDGRLPAPEEARRLADALRRAAEPFLPEQTPPEPQSPQNGPADEKNFC